MVRVGVVRLRDVDVFPEGEADVRHRHVVLAREIEQVGPRQEPSRVDLGHARHAAGVFLEIDAEDPARATIHGPHRARRHVDHARLAHGLRERGDGRHAARGPAADEIGEALERLGEDEPPLEPQRLTPEVPAGQIFRERERGDWDATHLPPALDPVSRHRRARHRRRPARTRARPDPAPGARSRRHPPKARGERGDAPHADGQRRGNATRAQERRQLVLVAAALKSAQARQEQSLAQGATRLREAQHAGVGGGNDERDVFLTHEARDGGQHARIAGDGVVAIRRRLLQRKTVVVAADDDQRGVARAEAADEIVGGPAARFRHEDGGAAHRRRDVLRARRDVLGIPPARAVASRCTVFTVNPCRAPSRRISSRSASRRGPSRSAVSSSRSKTSRSLPLSLRAAVA